MLELIMFYGKEGRRNNLIEYGLVKL